MRDLIVRIVSARKANLKEIVLMNTTRIRIGPDDPSTFPRGRIDPAMVDAATQTEIAEQEREDEAAAMQDMACCARRIRCRVGLSNTGTETPRHTAVCAAEIRGHPPVRETPTRTMRAPSSTTMLPRRVATDRG